MPGSAAYHMPAALRMSGDLFEMCLRRAVEHLLRRHDILRTRFVPVDSAPMQVIDCSSVRPLPIIDLRSVAARQKTPLAIRLATQDASCPFRLTQESLLRTRLLRLGSSEQVLLLNVHHLVSDGWSMNLLVRELQTSYSALKAGRDPSLPPLPIQYADYAIWEGTTLDDATVAADVEYWRQRLEGLTPFVLPADRLGPRSRRGRKRQTMRLPESLGDLRPVEGATWFTKLLSAFFLAANFLTGREDLSVGTDVALRDDPLTEPLIGPVLNQLVLNVSLHGDPCYREVVRRVRDCLLNAYAHRHTPFELVLSKLSFARAGSSNPLFRVLVGHANLPPSAPGIEGISMAPLPVENSQPATLDFTIYFEHGAEGEVATYTYDGGLFSAGCAQSIMNTFNEVCQLVARQPDITLSDVRERLRQAHDERRHRNIEEVRSGSRARLHQARRRTATST